MDENKEITPVPELEPETPKIRKSYMCGYIPFMDQTIMLHVRNIDSEKIDYFAKLTKFIGSKEPFSVRKIMGEIAALAVCDYAPRVYKSTGSENDKVSDVAVITYPDEFNKIHILLVDNRQDRINTLVNKITTQCHIGVEEIVARSMGHLYNLDVNAFPKLADFAVIAQKTDVSKSISDYLMHNESIQCDLI